MTTSEKVARGKEVTAGRYPPIKCNQVTARLLRKPQWHSILSSLLSSFQLHFSTRLRGQKAAGLPEDYVLKISYESEL
jgi:hypothetical protein